MIVYDPISGDPLTTPVAWRPRTCFVITKLGRNVPSIVNEIRQRSALVLRQRKFAVIDAGAATTGQDFLRKIWQLILEVPIGIAIVYQSMPARTMGNVFYELGLAQALGKETLVIKAPKATIPSDFVRTEHIEYDDGFEQKLTDFTKHLRKRAAYYQTVAQNLEQNNPLVAIDYYRRAYLLTGKKHPRLMARAALEGVQLSGSVGTGLDLLLGFCRGGIG